MTRAQQTRRWRSLVRLVFLCPAPRRLVPTRKSRLLPDRAALQQCICSGVIACCRQQPRVVCIADVPLNSSQPCLCVQQCTAPRSFCSVKIPPAKNPSGKIDIGSFVSVHGCISLRLRYRIHPECTPETCKSTASPQCLVHFQTHPCSLPVSQVVSCPCCGQVLMILHPPVLILLIFSPSCRPPMHWAMQRLFETCAWRYALHATSPSAWSSREHCCTATTPVTSCPSTSPAASRSAGSHRCGSQTALLCHLFRSPRHRCHHCLRLQATASRHAS